jgi:hypothetical protein
MSKFLEWYKDWSGFDDIDDIEDASQEALATMKSKGLSGE